MHKLALLSISALAVSACADSQAKMPTSAQQVIAIVDLSGSQTAETLARHREYLDELVRRRSYGDQFVLLEMNRRHATDEVRRFVQDFPAPTNGEPTSYDARQLEGARSGALAVIPMYFDTLAGSVATTDIISTLHVAGEYVQDRADRRTTLVLLSDMLQSTSAFEMDGLKRMPDADWLKQQAELGVLPHFEGVCVVVVGANTSDQNGSAVRTFWESYFEETGAVLRAGNYRLRAPREPLGC